MKGVENGGTQLQSQLHGRQKLEDLGVRPDWAKKKKVSSYLKNKLGMLVHA
jgi:hypothetical protein